MVKISGYNVFPQEIENVVNKVPGVLRCCAVAADDGGRPAVRLYVQPAPGADRDALDKAVRTETAARLMKYSVPRFVEYVDRLPLTQIGKVDYRQLEENKE